MVDHNTKVLVIAPHADDEAFGCGGTICRMANKGAQIYLAVGSLGHTVKEANVRDAEMHKAMGVLGIRETTTLAYLDDASLNTVPTRNIVSAIDDILDLEEFDFVFLPYPSHHEDHRIIQRATIAALRPGARSYTPHNILMYEYTYPSWSNDDTPKGRYYIALSEENVSTKMEAIRAYKSQLRQFPHPVSLDTAYWLTRIRGMAIQVPFAEMFYVIQMIKDI